MESNPVIKATQKGIKVDRPEDAALASAFVEKGTVSADALGGDAAMEGFLGIFDLEEGSVSKMRKDMKAAGIDQAEIEKMTNISIGGSMEELLAADKLMSETQKGLESGEFSAADVTGFVQNIDKVAETFAKATATGSAMDTSFQKNLIKNAEKADEIANVDFTDPKALLLVDLKAQFPEYGTIIDANKENAQQILDLARMVDTAKATDIFKPGVLEVFLDPANEVMGSQLDDGFANLLVSDPNFFKSVMPVLKANPQLPSQLFVELNKLNLSSSELTTVLADIQKGPQATPPGSPPSQVAQLSLQGEAGMLGLLDNYSFMNGTLDPSLFVASQQVLASVFFTEANDAYTALSDLDKSHSPSDGQDSGGADLDELILGGRQISIGSGNYPLASAGAIDFLVASTDKLTLTGNVVFSPSSTASDLILMSAGTLDLSGASSVFFGGDELGIGSFNQLDVKNVSLSAGEISLRSLDSVVIDNVEMQTTGKGADFVHLLAANELQVNNLRFSESVKQVAMEAMTINLSNVTFPSASSVSLKSLYGGIDGKYPNFNTIMYGRVNFIQQVKSGNHLIMDRAAFDAHGGNITIGTSK
ncbi:MAG TPA: hypothetical protein DCX67_00175 [Opitutae bacterium]|nr:hypothetical protein [Opitutae bacterium]|tara:strand:+ start:338 stop:2107 length:1770 start_codon:yes stop_codon:yes gene_type:complete